MEIEMYIEWPEEIVELGIISKEFIEEYCILPGNSMYVIVDALLLWIRMLAKYLVNEWSLKRSEADSCILFRKYDKHNLELVISVHVDDLFMDGKP